jgi:catechol 2,3-dioxygenase-like lactoylglutathione lyase family enzyme
VRWRGVHHVEFAVLNYESSIAFYDAMFGWLGYMSFWTLDIDYRSTYYMTRFPAPHSYIGIQPARTGIQLDHTVQAVGINHIALWAKSRKEVDRFCREFLTTQGIRVTDEPTEYPHYWPGYYAVFFDDPINGIHWELAWLPKIPSPRQVWTSYRALRKIASSRPDLVNSVPRLARQAVRNLPSQQSLTAFWEKN